MLLVDFLPPKPDVRWDLARQMGITYAITKLNPQLTCENPPWDIDVLRAAQERFGQAGLTLYGLEGDQMDMERIKQGTPGRDEDLARYRQMLRNMGELDIRLICYNFMAQIGWFRTNTEIRERGGALVSGFDANEIESAPLTEAGEISEAAVWENYQYFIRAVAPQAEVAGVKMGLHPDDPPWSPLCGIGRIFTSAQAVRRALSLIDGPFHGATFCQGTYTAMGEDVQALAREFAGAGKLLFVHFRDVRGTRGSFVETFHDNGPTDMPAMLRLYHELGFDGPIRVDHVPGMAGESNDDPGYGSQGRLFAVGYLKGLLDAQNIPYM